MPKPILLPTGDAIHPANISYVRAVDGFDLKPSGYVPPRVIIGLDGVGTDAHAIERASFAAACELRDRIIVEWMTALGASEVDGQAAPG